jgi:hypothetical protein
MESRQPNNPEIEWISHRTEGADPDLVEIQVEEALSFDSLFACPARVEQIEDATRRRLILRLRALLQRARVEHRVDIDLRAPADWYQAFRERWAPSWWLAWYPVRYIEHHVHRSLPCRICPHLEVEAGVEHAAWLAGGRDEAQELRVGQQTTDVRCLLCAGHERCTFDPAACPEHPAADGTLRLEGA